MNEPSRPYPKSQFEPEGVKMSFEVDRAIRLEADFTAPDSCLLAFMALYLEIQRRHGAEIARTMARWCQTPDREMNDKRNVEWMTLLRDGGLSLEKFAADLAEENKRFVGDKGAYSRGADFSAASNRDAFWLAMRATVRRAERRPLGFH